MSNSVIIFSVEELRARTLRRIDGGRVDAGAQHLQIGTCTLELEPEHVAQFGLKRALDRWVRGYIKQYNQSAHVTTNSDGARMIGARVIGLEIVKFFEP